MPESDRRGGRAAGRRPGLAASGGANEAGHVHLHRGSAPGPEEIARQILDLANRPSFAGYGPLPGIKAAEFEARPPGVVGTRVRVTNTDGSRHVEEVVAWEPGRRVGLEMTGFSPPLSRLATRFEEAWEFERAGDLTRVVRTFGLHPRSALARPALWLIARLLKRAVARHLRQMGQPPNLGEGKMR